MNKGRIHINIGDTQQKEDVPTKHLQWIGRYVYDQFKGQDVDVVHNGDHWDMPSLSSYDKGKAKMEGRRYRKDIKAGNDAMEILTEPMVRSAKTWLPRMHFLMGNHEDRITRAANDHAELEGTVSLSDLNAKDLGWKVHKFLEEVELDGVTYSHYFYNPVTGRPYGGENLHPRLKTIGRSFTMGHQQGIKYAVREVGRLRHHGLVNGSCYLHEEEYMGPQATAYWRGIVVCHQVEKGMYDPMFVSLEYLCRRYEKKTLKQFLGKAA